MRRCPSTRRDSEGRLRFRLWILGGSRGFRFGLVVHEEGPAGRAVVSREGDAAQNTDGHESFESMLAPRRNPRDESTVCATGPQAPGLQRALAIQCNLACRG